MFGELCVQSSCVPLVIVLQLALALLVGRLEPLALALLVEAPTALTLMLVPVPMRSPLKSPY